MSLKDFLRFLRENDGIIIKFSHTGYVVIQGNDTVACAGNHTSEPPTNLSPRDRVYLNNNMYAAIGAACAASQNAAILAGHVMATLHPGAKSCKK